MFWKTKPPLVVTIPQPCHESWNEMSLAERGRYCKACQTVVTDFTILSDDEIIRHIENAAGGKMCGRFSHLQIDRPLVANKKLHRIGTFRKVAASLLFFYASIHKTSAQTTFIPNNTYTSDKTKRPLATATGMVISGKVIDFTQQGVHGLELELKGTGITNTTDAHGNFKFLFPDTIVLNEIVIGPTHSGRLFLDSIGAIIRENEMNLDTFSLKTSITINLYPIADLAETNVAAVRDTHVAIAGAMIMSPPTLTPVSVPDNLATGKKTIKQKFKSLFKQKSNQ